MEVREERERKGVRITRRKNGEHTIVGYTARERERERERECFKFKLA